MIISYFIAEIFQQNPGKAYLLHMYQANSYFGQGFEIILHHISSHRPHC